MKGTYNLFTGTNSQYYWNLTAPNNEIILQSESYTTKQNALNGIGSCRTNSPLDSRYQRRIAKNSQYYFNLTALNYQIIGVSEMYTTVANRDNGIMACKKYGPGATLNDKT